MRREARDFVVKKFELAAFVLTVALAWSLQAATDPVPQRMLGTWAKDGKCALPSERLVITQTTATFGGGHSMEIEFHADEFDGRGALRWKGEGTLARYVEPSDTLAFYGLGWGMGGPTAGYRRCQQ